VVKQVSLSLDTAERRNSPVAAPSIESNHRFSAPTAVDTN